MILLQFSLLILLPISLLSQEANKFEIADSIINVKEIIKDAFGDNMMRHSDELKFMGSPYFIGVLELDNVLEKMGKKKMRKLPGTCQCHMMLWELEIVNAIGFMGGIANVIEINIEDSTYHSKIYLHTDGMRAYKFKQDEEFTADFEVMLEETTLEISPNSKFENNGIVKGKLKGTTIKYYELDFSDSGFNEVQTKVLSIFECKLEDYGQMMIDMGLECELEIIQKEMGKEKKKQH